MTREEFWDYINGPKIIRQVYIVHIRQKHTESENWEYTNEVLEPDSEGGFIWRNDWYEGEKYVEILGCIAVSDAEVPDFEEEHPSGVSLCTVKDALITDEPKQLNPVYIPKHIQHRKKGRR